MNLIDYFKQGMTLSAYLPSLGELLALHQRYYRQTMITPADQSILLPSLKILIITEPGCLDSAIILPTLQKIFENKQAEIRILLRDNYPELMDLFLTNGRRAIPVVLFLEENGDLLFRFGPRPNEAQKIFEEHRSAIQKGKVDKTQVVIKIRRFYARNKGRAIIKEIVQQFKDVVMDYDC